MEMILRANSRQRVWATILGVSVLGGCVVGCERAVIVASTRHGTERVQPSSGDLDNRPVDAGEARVSGVAGTGIRIPTSAAEYLYAGAVAAVLRGAIEPIRSCYEQALRTQRELRGILVIHFTIQIDGTASFNEWRGVAFEGTSVGGCVGRVVARLTFPRRTRGSVEYSFPFNFSPAP